MMEAAWHDMGAMNGYCSKQATAGSLPGKSSQKQKRVPRSWLSAVALVALASVLLTLGYGHEEVPGGEEGAAYVTAIWAMEDQAGKAVWSTLWGRTQGKRLREGLAALRARYGGSGEGPGKGEGEDDSGDAFEEGSEDAPGQQSEQVVRQRKLWRLEEGEKFMWYGAHGGFGNQVIQMRWALRMAGLLNRTLILPPKLPHFNRVPSIGSCAKRPTPVAAIRAEAWKEYSALLADPAYVSIGDVLDMRRLPPRLLRTIDLRHFVARHCGCFVGRACQGRWCLRLSHSLLDAPAQAQCMQRCAAKMGGLEEEGGSHKWVRRKQLYLVPNTCGDTVWTIGKYSCLQELERAVGSADPNLLPFVHTLGRRGSGWPSVRNLQETLGTGSPAAEATVLAVGSTFHPRIGDISLAGWPPQIELLRNVTHVLPFTPEIMAVGKEYARRRIGHEFACLHLRAGDSFFIADLPGNLRRQEDAVKKLHSIHTSQRDEKGRLVLFLMTDLKPSQWNGTFLGRLGELGFNTRTGREVREEIQRAGRDTMLREYGLFANRIDRVEADQLLPPAEDIRPSNEVKKLRAPQDVALFVEQTICSCAALGFIGTTKSTASGHVHNMRTAKYCQEP